MWQAAVGTPLKISIGLCCFRRLNGTVLPSSGSCNGYIVTFETIAPSSSIVDETFVEGVRHMLLPNRGAGCQQCKNHGAWNRYGGILKIVWNANITSK
jgi:hypothetical protein